MGAPASLLNSVCAAAADCNDSGMSFAAGTAAIPGGLAGRQGWRRSWAESLRFCVSASIIVAYGLKLKKRVCRAADPLYTDLAS